MILKEAFIAICQTNNIRIEAWMEEERAKKGVESGDIRKWLRTRTDIKGLTHSELYRTFAIWGSTG